VLLEELCGSELPSAPAVPAVGAPPAVVDWPEGLPALVLLVLWPEELADVVLVVLEDAVAESELELLEGVAALAARVGSPIPASALPGALALTVLELADPATPERPDAAGFRVSALPAVLASEADDAPGAAELT
jgi:hypothetical protein